MKPSDLIRNNNYMLEMDTETQVLEIIDAFAEDIEYLKKNLNHPFPYCIEKPIKREWEK
jgi:hypothetical protein